MKYYLGPWNLVNDNGELYYSGPSGAMGQLDFGTVPEQSVQNPTRRGCFCWTDGRPLPSEYTEIGDGDIRELKAGGRIKSAFESHLGYRPQGDTLAELVMDVFTDGADPDGQSSCVPIMPDSKGWYELHTHGYVKGERFEWGKGNRPGHRDKIQRMLRKQFRGLMDDAQNGKLKDREHHRRVLDAWCDKFKVDDWKEFVDRKDQKDVPGRLKHETTYADNFNRANDSSSMGTASGGFSWGPEGTWGISSNSGYRVTGSGAGSTRAEADLSSSDNYTQIDQGTGSTTATPSPICRYQSGARTGYFARKSSTAWDIFKLVAGTFTNLSTPADTTALPYTLKVSANGSTITAYANGVSVSPVTDTAIATGLRGGLRATNTSLADNFEMGDISGGGGGILYTQLERGTRGVERGVWTRY